MEVSMPVLPSQHTDYADASAVAAVRHHRLPLQESTGNVQPHASGPNSASNSNPASGYCSPVTAVPAVVSSAASTSLPLVSCTPASATPTPSIPTPPIVPTQSLDRQQQNAYHHSQHQQQQQQNLYSAGSLAKPLYQQPSQHHHNEQQQLLARRQSVVRHHNASSLAGMTGPLAGNNLLSNTYYGHPGIHSVTGGASNNTVLALQVAAAAQTNTDVNPIYLSPQFQAYRKKQGEKDDKTEQIWPDVLEDAFLDALLLIPQMGRKKYAMRGQLHGRNMLISEYLWVAYCLSLPPGAKPDRKMARGRKQVSSHIQVLKNFFIHHRCYHFFFPSKEKKEDSRKDVVEKESFKDNPVLRALFEGRLPDERPNYEYFGQLLASDALVAVRPSLCWILVSSSAVRFESEGHRRGEAFKSDGLPLDGRMYPHLGLNLKREEWPERGKIIRGTLLQEYTRALSQKEASSVREVSQDWEERFPGPMMDALDGIVRDDLRDILHFHVTLDVQEPDRFPEGSELNSLVEVTIEQPNLQNHRWKSVTRLARPWELMPSGATADEGTNDADQVPVSVITREIGNQYMHRPGCHGVGNGGHCDCFHGSRLRRQQLAVPFPAPEWATMLSMLTGYRKHPLEPENGSDGSEMYTTTQRASSLKKSSSSSSKRSSFGSTTTTTTTTTTSRRHSNDAGDETGDDSFVSTSSSGSNGSNGAPPTQMDLVRNIAMLQELWSCGPSSATTTSSPPDDGAADGQTWTRRAVILWTFETVYSVNEKKMEVVKSPAGTGWRFLTTIDPTSQFHQQQALVTPAIKAQQQQQQAAAIQHQQAQAQAQARYQPQMHTPAHHQQMGYPTSRDNIMSPHPGYQQHLNAAMSEHLSGAAWDPTMAAAVAAATGYSSMSTTTATGYNPAAPAGTVYRQHHSLSPQAPQPYGVPSPLNLLDTTAAAYGAGLTTPPPTASLPSPYDHHQQPSSAASVGASNNGGNNPYTHHPQGFQSQLSFMSAGSTASGSSPGAENHHHSHHNTHRAQHHQQSVQIDPFLAGGGGGGGTSGVHQHHQTTGGASELPDWDANDMTSALEGWPAVNGAPTSTTTSTAPQTRGQKRGRSDSLDGGNGGFPAASMPKLNHNGFNNWR
ncbi:hypothetical protein HMPREF1624_03084 [Sporothrix schenckii ATCC 58251]|uniref:TEA domain-containing protein n=1 Tax=Sporothrix schenckii (strain ATCC 58251 / de Perez 2211183) TaxID=1391915 RepID=U7PZ06_SPOS1|nr:hypothetical protein HMPREF1624_03084 [Sporothrix schenckii ATCC 58251]